MLPGAGNIFLISHAGLLRLRYDNVSLFVYRVPLRCLRSPVRSFVAGSAKQAEVRRVQGYSRILQVVLCDRADVMNDFPRRYKPPL